MLTNWFPSLLGIINQYIIPLAPRPDELNWKHNLTGTMSLKDAFSFKSLAGANLRWAKLIWNKSIHPSKSLFVWKLLNSMVPTDDQLASRGIMIFPCRCVLCGCHEETTLHIFFTASLLKEFGTG